MATITLSPKAADSVRDLPKDRTLLTAIWRHLERAAESPNEHLWPPAFPYVWPMMHFKAYDTAGSLWGVTVLVDTGNSGFRIVMINAAPFPTDLDPNDFEWSP